MKRASGFTMIEVMIGSALVGLVSIGILTVIISFAKSNSRYAARQDLAELEKVVQLLLTNETICDRALTGGGGAPLDFVPPSIQVNAVSPPGTTPPLIQSGQPYNRLQIGQMTLDEIVEDPPPAAPRVETISLTDAAGVITAQTYQIYRANLMIPTRTRNQATNVAVDSFAPLTIPIRIYTLQGATRIVRCQLAIATNQTCSSLGATYDAAQGRCVFPACNQAVITAQIPRVGGDYSCQRGADCSPDIYFWGYQALVPNTPTMPVCICTNSCRTPPAGGY